MIGLVVDTSVLHKANDANTPEHWDALSLLTRLSEAAVIYMDEQELILTEYRSAFFPGAQATAFWWWQAQLANNGIRMISGHLTEKQARIFSDRGCDKDDIAFIGVALRAGVPVVHEDSDYEEPCARELGITGHRLSAARAALGL